MSALFKPVWVKVSRADMAKRAIPKSPKSSGARTLAKIIVLANPKRRLISLREKTQSPPRATRWESVASGLSDLLKFFTPDTRIHH